MILGCLGQEFAIQYDTQGHHLPKKLLAENAGKNGSITVVYEWFFCLTWVNAKHLSFLFREFHECHFIRAFLFLSLFQSRVFLETEYLLDSSAAASTFQFVKISTYLREEQRRKKETEATAGEMYAKKELQTAKNNNDVSPTFAFFRRNGKPSSCCSCSPTLKNRERIHLNFEFDLVQKNNAASFFFFRFCK